jgi:hypothetical protein
LEGADEMIFAQIVMVLVLVLMISGKTPLYLTAILGASIAGLVAGFPLTGTEDVTILKLINSGLHPVIADMAGVLLFIGIMQKAGFLDVIIKKVIEVGRKAGGGPGVAAGGGIAAGIIGALTGFTQPAITAAITGPAAIKLGVDPHKTAGMQAHAGHLGNFGGFTHPTMVAVVATAGIAFGMINILGAIVALSVFAISFFRLKKEEKAKGISFTDAQLREIAATFEINTSGISFGTAITPFILLLVGFVLGYPIFLVGIVSAIIVSIMGKLNMFDGEKAMLEGVARIATPLVATIGFLFMSAVIREVGLVRILADFFDPVLSVSPLLVMLVVSALTGLFTQSLAASAAIIIPFLDVVLGTGVSPLAAAVPAVGGAALMQYYLTGGPVAALATAIPVVPGSELKQANKFQRPSILGGLGVLLVVTIILMIVF